MVLEMVNITDKLIVSALLEMCLNKPRPRVFLELFTLPLPHTFPCSHLCTCRSLLLALQRVYYSHPAPSEEHVCFEFFTPCPPTCILWHSCSHLFHICHLLQEGLPLVQAWFWSEHAHKLCWCNDYYQSIPVFVSLENTSGDKFKDV